MGIDGAKETIERVVDTVSKWESFAKDAGVYDAHVEQIKANLLLLRPHS